MAKCCALCGREIPANRKSNNTKYCSERCQRKASLTPSRVSDIIERGKRKSKRNPDLLFAFGHKCAICGWSIPQWIPGYKHHELAGGCEMHHVIPVCEGGTEETTNLILLCPNCHKMAHVGILIPEQLFEHVLTDDDVTRLKEERRLQAAAEYKLDEIF